MTPLRVGDVLYGYCEGHFDDVYDDKRVEAVGADWVVARTESGAPVFYSGPPERLAKFRDKPEDPWTA